MWIHKSKEWRFNAQTCERCGKDLPLTCHHRDYKSKGFEKREDIRVLCWKCHKKYHYKKGKFKRKFKKYTGRGISSFEARLIKPRIKFFKKG